MPNQGSDSPHDPPEPEQMLQKRVAALETAMLHLEARIGAMEKGSELKAKLPLAPDTNIGLIGLPEAPPLLEAASFLSLLGMAGRVCLILGGAFLIRTITDGGALPRSIGVTLGLLYALAWALVADRQKDRSIESSCYLLTAAFIAYPLLWEATTRFAVLPPFATAGALLVVTGLFMMVARRRSLHGSAWTVTLCALCASFGLMLATSAVESFTAAFLVMGIGSLLITQGGRWQGLRWAVALGADLAVLTATSLASWSGGPPEVYKDLSTLRVMALALSLVLIYLGNLGLETLRRHHTADGFQITQTLLVLLVGFGGAARVAHATGNGVGILGLAALVLGAGCYGIAFLFVEHRLEAKVNFPLFTTLALALVLAGTPLVLPGTYLILVSAGLGLCATILGVRYERVTLLVHGTTYLTMVALLSGFFPRAFQAFLAPAGLPKLTFVPLDLGFLVVLGASYIIMIVRSAKDTPWQRRIPSFIVGTWAVLGLGTLLLSLFAGLASNDLSSLATLRTCILSLFAMILAGLGRWTSASEMRWLVHPVLGLTALKFVFQDLPNGRPATLFLALTCYGAALILAPRILRERVPT